MRKQVVEHTSPLDALIGLAKRLAEYEIRHGLESEDFFNRYTQGMLGMTRRMWSGRMTIGIILPFAAIWKSA